MPTTSQIAELRTFIDNAATVAAADVSAFWLPTPRNLPALTAAATEIVPEIVAAYGDVSATVAADWYDETRPTVTSRYRAEIADALPLEQVQAMVRWALTPAWQANDWDAALANLLAGTARLVREPARTTIERNSWNDPAAGAYVRVAQSDACPFCLMLASRGAVYASQSTATTVGASRRGLRGDRKAGEPFHDKCRCTPSPVYGPGDIPDFNRALKSEWKTVTKGRSGKEALRVWSEHFSLTRA